MATLEELHAALQKADAAGDTESAKAIAQMYASQMGQPSAPQADTAPAYPPRWLGFPSPTEWRATHPEHPTLGDVAEQGTEAAGGGITGLAAQVPGSFGDIESAARWGLNKAGANVSPETWFKTSSQIGDALAGGPPSSPEAAVGRFEGSLLSPSAYLKLARAPGALVQTVKGAKAISAADKATGFAQNLAAQGGITPDALEAAQGAKPLTGAEALGPNAQTHLMALARREGGTGSQLGAAMTERAAGRTERIFDDMAASSGIHPDAAKGNIEAVVEQGRTKAKPLFDAALGSPGPVWNADLARLAERPAIKKAIAGAVEDLRNADIDPKAWGLEIDPMMGATGAKQLQPTAQAWDLIRKNLSSTVERDPFGKPIPDTVSRGNYNVNQATRDLTGALKSAIPGYEDALNVSGDYLSSKAAFDRGQSMILNANVTADQFAKAAAKMTPAELDAMKGGIANKIFDLAQNSRLNPKQFLTPLAQAKLEAALGKDKAQSLIANLQQESEMSAFERRAVASAGSQTAPLGQAMKEQDAFGQSPVGNVAADIMMHGPRGAILNFVASKREQLADLLKTRGLDVETRNELGKLLQLSPKELAKALRTVPGGGANLSPGAVNNVGITAGMMAPQALARLLQQGQNAPQ